MWPYHPDLLERAVPRYTSFPTAAEFAPDVGARELDEAIAQSEGAISLYVHIPFCEQICWYCGCNTGAANRTHRLTAYLGALEQEIARVASRLPRGAHVERIAFGGGSPNAIAPLDFVRLVDRLTTAFHVREPVISVELDPRGLDDLWARVIGAAGVTHASLGVQTFAPAIQQRIGRVQSAELIERSMAMLRVAGVRSVNFDLMYGLPGQDMAALEETLERSVLLGADRIALFGYAHVPHLLPRQRRIDASALPDQAERFAMAALGYGLLSRAGYDPVGFDHFARPHDPMAKAAREGRLRRNFQGFTDDQAPRLIGLGASAIALFPDRIVQNEKKAGLYRERIEAGGLAGAQGVWRGALDRKRGAIIEGILAIRPVELETCALLPGTISRLEPFLERGLIALEGSVLRPTQATLPYARAIAALFDPYRAGAPQRFSTAI